MQSVFYLLKSDSSWQYRLTLVSGIAVIFTLLGPFGTYDNMPYGEHLGYWFVMIGIADLVVHLAHRVATERLSQLHRVVRIMLRTPVFVVVYTPLAWLWSAQFESTLYSLEGFSSFLLNVCGVAAVLMVLAAFLCPDEVAPVRARVRLFDRLPTQTLASIMRLTVDDHHVDVYLDDGSVYRLRMRFADAIREMDEAPGFCTHRSHWVSRGHIVKCLREQGREFVVLVDGTKVPVSKTYRENILGAGFLEAALQ